MAFAASSVVYYCALHVWLPFRVGKDQGPDNSIDENPAGEESFGDGAAKGSRPSGCSITETAPAGGPVTNNQSAVAEAEVQISLSVQSGISDSVNSGHPMFEQFTVPKGDEEITVKSGESA